MCVCVCESAGDSALALANVITHALERRGECDGSKREGVFFLSPVLPVHVHRTPKFFSLSLSSLSKRREYCFSPACLPFSGRSESVGSSRVRRSFQSFSPHAALLCFPTSILSIFLLLHSLILTRSVLQQQQPFSRP